jgi:hypothetical protein
MTITFLEAKINVAEGQQNKLKTISLSQMGKLLQQKQQQTMANIDQTSTLPKQQGRKQ